MIKKLLPIFAITALTASAALAASTGTVSYQGPIMGSTAGGPAMFSITGDAATAIYNDMNKLAEVPDANGVEVERAGDGIVCHKRTDSGSVVCLLDFTDVSKGLIEHN